MAQSKSEWRRVLTAARSTIPESARSSASEAIATRVRRLRCVREARALLGYVAIGAEVDPSSIFANAGVPVLVPSGTSAGEAPAWILHGDGSPACMMEPGPARLDFPLVAVVPGVGFDESGTRLGRGGGFYDRALASLRSTGRIVAIGVAFDVQIVPELPRDAWDQPVDIVVSERRLLAPHVGTCALDGTEDSWT